MSKVGKTPKLLEVTPPKKDNSDEEDEDEEEPALKKPKEKARAVKPIKPKSKEILNTK